MIILNTEIVVKTYFTTSITYSDASSGGSSSSGNGIGSKQH